MKKHFLLLLFTAISFGQTKTVNRTGEKNTLSKSSVGLSNVDNTADTNKPISTATATALAAKADLSYINYNFVGISEFDKTKDYEALYVNNVEGLDTNNGSELKPFKTVQAAINSFTAGSPHVIYVKSSTTQPITFRPADQSMQIVLDPKTEHTGAINLVAGNTSIYFISNGGAASLSGIINDASSGNIYYNCMVLGTYNKTGGSGAIAPTGYVEFSPNSNIDGLVVNLSGNSNLRTLGTGAMGILSQSNGIFAAQHKGSMQCPIISGGTNPLVGQPICLLQGQIQLIKNAQNKSFICTATYGLVYLSGISTMQNDFSTYGKIDFSGSGVNCFCYVWSDSQLAPTGDTFPATGAVLTNLSNYINANFTPTSYSAANTSLQSHLAGINTAIGTKEPSITATASTDYFRGNKTFANFGADVRATALTGLSTVSTATILATDSTLSALGKLQAQLSEYNNGPTFSAYASGSQSVTSGVNTPVNIDTKDWDTSGRFNVSTYRFTPTTPGYYRIDGQVVVAGTVTRLQALIYKNGNQERRGVDTTSGSRATVSCVVQMNGTTDYVDLRGYATGSGLTFPGGSGVDSYFQGTFIRPL